MKEKKQITIWILPDWLLHECSSKNIIRSVENEWIISKWKHLIQCFRCVAYHMFFNMACTGAYGCHPIVGGPPLLKAG